MIILIFGEDALANKNVANKIYEDIWETAWAGAIHINECDWNKVTKNYDIYAFQTAIFLESRDYIPILSFRCPSEKIRSYLKENAKNLIQIYLHPIGEKESEQWFSNNFFDKPTGKYLSIDTSLDENNINKITEYIFENGKIDIEDEI